EMVQVANDSVQYQNWATPVAMSKLFQLFHQGKYLSKGSQALLVEYMSVAAPWFDRRIKGQLPPETKVMHKTGTSRTVEGLTGATNDAGIITLPDGRHLALSVFISDSYDDQKKREETIAKVSKAAFDYWTSDK
ncbi:MAG: serine hydrolase, partial [Bacteroidota bacterium]